MRVAKGEQQIDFVLLTGEAGSGKSTAARKLAYIWAKCQGLQEVTLVYMLQIRDLQTRHFNNKGDCFHAETLPTAVVWQLLPQTRGDKDTFVRVHKLVE